MEEPPRGIKEMRLEKTVVSLKRVLTAHNPWNSKQGQSNCSSDSRPAARKNEKPVSNQSNSKIHMCWIFPKPDNSSSLGWHIDPGSPVEDQPSKK
jgi:hypothetical protein